MTGSQQGIQKKKCPKNARVLSFNMEDVGCLRNEKTFFLFFVGVIVVSFFGVEIVDSFISGFTMSYLQH